MSDLRVLIVAENVSARLGGEAFLPLHYFRILRSRGVPVWLLTHERVKEELEELFPDEHDRMFFTPDTRTILTIWRIGKWIPTRVRGFTTGFAVLSIARRMQRKIAVELIAQENINVLHEPIPVSPRAPSSWCDMGVPVVIGPMNGGMSFPPAFKNMQGIFRKVMLAVLSQFVELSNRIMPGKRKAAVLLVANQRTREALPHVTRGVLVEEIVENAVDLTRFKPATDQARDSSIMHYAFVGSLIDSKGVDLLLEATAKLRCSKEVRLSVFGDGPMRTTLEAQVQRLGLEPQVKFHGFVPQDVLAEKLAYLDGLVLPTLFECGGAVVLEAMALGLPVIATNWGGPADYLDEACGILIEPNSAQSMIDQLVEAMTRLAEDPELRRQLGRRGQEKVKEQFDWEAKVDTMQEVYRAAIDRSEST